MFTWEGVDYPHYNFDYTTNLLIRKNGQPLAIHSKNNGYKEYQVWKDGKPKYILVHRLVYFMHHPNGDKTLTVNHKNHVLENNDISNLNLATMNQQNCYQRKRQNTSSTYKGVCWNKQANKWHSSIRINGKTIYIGLFNSERDAGLAYNNYIINNGLNDGFRILNDIPKIKLVIKKK